MTQYAAGRVQKDERSKELASAGLGRRPDSANFFM
jgi:hypothetical protein